jgi:hypothetical protein
MNRLSRGRGALCSWLLNVSPACVHVCMPTVWVGCSCIRLDRNTVDRPVCAGFGGGEGDASIDVH